MDLHNTNLMNQLFSGEEELKVFADRPPKLDNETLTKYNEAGFNYYIMTEDYLNLFVQGTRTLNQEYLSALRELKNKGFKILIRNHGNYSDYFEGITDELSEYVDGFYMCDEPTYKNVDSGSWVYESATFDELLPLVAWYNTYGNQKLFHINLLQSYGVEMLHNDVTFSKYVDLYVEQVLSKVNGPKTISTDFYPLVSSNGVNSIKEYYLSDLMTIAVKAKQMIDSGEDIHLGYAIQNFADDGLGCRNATSEKDFTFQVYTAMALGAKNLEYYVYAYTQAPDGTDANEFGGVFVDKECTTYNARYDYIKSANEKAQAYAKALLKFNWNGAQLVNGTYNCNTIEKGHIKDMEISSFAKVRNINCHSDVLVSEFTKGNNYAYMFVNYTEPSSTNVNLQSNAVSALFDGATHAIVCQNGVKTIVKLDNGAFTASLGLGEACFVYPIYN